MTSDSRIEIMMAGVPGSMATEVAELILDQPDMTLLKDMLTGPDQKPGAQIRDRIFHLHAPEDHSRYLEAFPGAVVVDFTLPSVVNTNARLYRETRHPFVMGTTGGDRDALVATIRGSEVSAVIAPNMAGPIVVAQAMVDWAAKTFPGALDGFSLAVKESHQATKRDVSGTALAFQALFETLGAKLDDEGVTYIRNRYEGHGYHWFTLKGADGTVTIELNTKVDGRQVYALGTLAAIRFLHARVQEGSQGKVFSMIDVLRGIGKGS